MLCVCMCVLSPLWKQKNVACYCLIIASSKFGCIDKFYRLNISTFLTFLLFPPVILLVHKIHKTFEVGKNFRNHIF